MLLLAFRYTALLTGLFTTLLSGVVVHQVGSVGNARSSTGRNSATIDKTPREIEERAGGFHRVIAVNKNNLWAIGLEGDGLNGSENSVILNSTDSGFSWTRSLLIQHCHLDDILFQGALTGWVIGSEQERGLILHTSDGGRNWTRQRSDSRMPLWRLTFVSRTHGWITGWGGRVLRTDDGGALWSSLRLPFGWVNDEIKAEIKDVSFADEKNGWIVGEMGRAHTSTDGGSSWEPRTPQLGQLMRISKPWQINFKRVSFFGKKIGAIIVEINDKPDPSAPASSYMRKLVILRTEDGGRNWLVRKTIETPTFVSAQFLSGDEWWVRTLSRTSLHHTTDAGKTWSEVTLTNDVIDGPVLFLDSNLGWLFSYRAGFFFDNLLTRDGGKTWTTQRISYITS